MYSFGEHVNTYQHVAKALNLQHSDPQSGALTTEQCQSLRLCDDSFRRITLGAAFNAVLRHCLQFGDWKCLSVSNLKSHF